MILNTQITRPPPTDYTHWFDTSFGTIIIRVKLYHYHVDYEHQCTYHGDYLRVFLPRSEVENEWLIAFSANVSRFLPVRGYHVTQKIAILSVSFFKALESKAISA